MSPGKFNASLNDVERLLGKIGFSPEREYSPDYASLPASVRHLTYVEQWRYFYKERIYDFKIFDSSLFQLQPAPLSYSFIECPFEIPSFSAFASRTSGTQQEESATLRAEYELFISSLEQRATTPVRFDYDPKAYREGLHPAAHVHVGYRSNVRVATERLLSPMSFILLILRQCYPDHWAKLQGTAEIVDRRGEIRTNLTKIEPAFRRSGDFDEMYLV